MENINPMEHKSLYQKKVTIRKETLPKKTNHWFWSVEIFLEWFHYSDFEKKKHRKTYDPNWWDLMNFPSTGTLQWPVNRMPIFQAESPCFLASQSLHGQTEFRNRTRQKILTNKHITSSLVIYIYMHTSSIWHLLISSLISLFHNTPMWPCDFFAEIHTRKQEKPHVPLFWGRGPKGRSQNLSQAGAQSDGIRAMQLKWKQLYPDPNVWEIPIESP